LNQTGTQAQGARADVKADWLLVALMALPLAVALAKLPMFPTSSFCASFFSLADLPAQFHKSVENVLLIPLGALVVVLFRLTLGLRVLGLFRPILMAMAFDVLGIPISLAFLLLVLVIIVVLRPLLQTDHNYARVAVLLSLASALLFAPLMAGKWWDVAWLREIVFFPVIALCLTCESFARVLDGDGVREAVWRTFTTVVAASLIVGLTRLPGVLGLFLHFPELLLVQAGCILLINKYFDFRAFEGANPLAARTTESAAGPTAEHAMPVKQLSPAE
jgi:hypothetical protein